MKFPTGADVANLAGVSREAVSQIINGHADRFRPETVNRVMAAIHELGYRPSAAGRALRLGSSPIALLLLRDVSDHALVLETMGDANARTAADGLTILACVAPRNIAELGQLLTQVRPAIVISPTFSEAERTTIENHRVLAVECGTV